MRLLGVLSFLFLAFVASTNAQPGVDWIRTYHNQVGEGLTDVYAESGGGYVMCGYAYINRVAYDPTWNAWVIRTEENGREIWSGTYGNPELRDIASTIIETDQGTFMVGGLSGAQNPDVAVWHIDENGDQIWFNLYAPGWCNAIIELKSGEYILGGRSEDMGYLACINLAGDLLWQRTYGREEVWNEIHGLRETEGGILATGYEHTRSWAIKINFEGELLWSNLLGRQDRSSKLLSVVSASDNGFIHGGYECRGSQADFWTIKINPEGEEIWSQTYAWNHDAFSFVDNVTCVCRLDGGDIAMVGYVRGSGEPALGGMIRTSPNGNERWRRLYDFNDIEDLTPPILFSSVIRGHDNSILAAGSLVNNENNQDYDGFLIKLVPEILQPQFIQWSPEDTILTVLQGDTIDFLVRAFDQQGDEMTYLWIMGEDTLSHDSTTTVTFEELGEFEVQCQVTDGEFTPAITWHITVTDFVIRDFAPDSLEMTVRRGAELEFSLVAEALNEPGISYLWTLTDRNQRRFEVGETDTITVSFPLTGHNQLEGLAQWNDQIKGVMWEIDVQSLVWWWWPHEDELTVREDTIVSFEVFPFDEDADPLSYSWQLDQEPLDSDSSTLDLHFPQAGQHQVTALVSDDVEADTIRWSVNVEEWSFTADFADYADLPGTAVLYPASPNPFNSSVKLSMSLPKADHVSLAVFDVNGREVARLVDGTIAPGSQTFVWNANEFPAGVYLVRMETGDVMEMRKVVLVR